MANIKNTCFRLNLDKPLYSEAWQHLQTMDKKEFKSYSQAIAIAVTDYFERHNRRKSDPYFENREREEVFVQQIIGEVQKELQNTVPNFLTSCLAGIKISPSANVPEVPVNLTDDTTFDNIDLDFVGG